MEVLTHRSSLPSATLDKRFLVRFFATLGSIGIYVLPFLIGLGLVYAWLHGSLLAPIEKGNKETVLFEIKEGWDINTIAQKLEDSGLLAKAWSLEFLSNLRSSDDGKALSIVSGEYSLSKGQTPSEILSTLLGGGTVKHDLVIPVGVTVQQAAKIIGDAHLVSEEEAYQALRNHSTMVRLGIPAYIPEGYLMAGTYQFSKPIKGQQIVAEIVTKSQEMLDQQLEDWKARASALGFSPYEILTLASLLEKETSDPLARKTISSIFHNRLRIGMELESLASLRYTLPDTQVEITREDILAPGPYNLFQNMGLPPTPICTPSLDSIQAALYPEDTDYLYFFKADDGTFVFSETGSEHRKQLQAHGRAPEVTTNEEPDLVELP